MYVYLIIASFISAGIVFTYKQNYSIILKIVLCVEINDFLYVTS